MIQVKIDIIDHDDLLELANIILELKEMIGIAD